ncbi:MAG TPA: hypothetical protein VNI01_12165 [Elusimicrobiota bacterium]|jgi:hypothetical protein|nr:hypothetical protein [Elusimicrobiota bacterium]
MNIERRAGSILLAVVAAVALFGSRVHAEEPVNVVSKLKDLKLKVYGFVETDIISDSTQGQTEEQDNAQIQKRTASGGGADNYAGQHHRTQMTVRNSRLGFELSVPKTAEGIETKGVLELDALGNQGVNTVPGSAPGTQTERDYFNNGAIRVRHAYVDLTYGQWNAKIGQYWSLLGWQPYYFPGENAILPTPGMLYRRFVQARVTNTRTVADAWTVETAVDAAKPAESNSGVPEFHAGARLASTQYKSASSAGAGTAMIPLSLAVSGALIPVRTAVGNSNGEAVALDFSVPILRSSDGKDKSNNLTWMGEAMNGRGVGGLELAGLTAGVGGVTAATAGTAVDSGIAGFTNAAGTSMALIGFRLFRTHLQYTLPGGKWAVSGGYSQVEGRNLQQFSFSAATINAISPKQQYGFLTVMYDPLAWLRLAADFNQTRDTYNDNANRHAQNNRAQFTTYFVF